MKEQIPPPYRYAEIRRLCQRIVNTAKLDSLCEHRLKIHDIRPFQMTSDWDIGMHTHSFYEAHFFLRGDALYTLHETQHIGPGTLVFHPPYTPHSWGTTDELDPVLLLVFSFSLHPVVKVPTPECWPVLPDLVEDINELLRDAQEMQPGWRDRVTFRLGLILSKITSSAEWPPQEAPGTDKEDTLVAVVDQFLKDNLSRKVTISDIAAHVGMSVSSLAHNFIRLTGGSVMERLFYFRMDKAADLLVDTDISMAEIGAMVGMPEPSYFGRRFRKHFGMTPATYRRGITLPSTATAGIS